jgi:tetratricopeptide (TPR) repeat protein
VFPFGERYGILAVQCGDSRWVVVGRMWRGGWTWAGVLRVWVGQPDIAIEHVESALRLSPRTRGGPSFDTIGAAHFVSGRFDEAVPKLLLAIQADPSFAQPYRVLAACYAHTSHEEEVK